jgi:hypothetical protein
MATKSKRTDRKVQTVLDALKKGYGASHPKAKIEAYRYNPASIRVRIIDADFVGKGLVEREEEVWPIIESIPEDVRMEVSILLLITPSERKQSLGSMEFDDPTPSLL